MHFEHVAGDKLLIDFTGKKLSIVNGQTGEVKEAEIFVATLGCSQFTYVEALSSQKKEQFIKATQNALYYFGGVPRVLVCDNLKSGVTKASNYEADLPVYPVNCRPILLYINIRYPHRRIRMV